MSIPTDIFKRFHPFTIVDVWYGFRFKAVKGNYLPFQVDYGSIDKIFCWTPVNDDEWLAQAPKQSDAFSAFELGFCRVVDAPFYVTRRTGLEDWIKSIPELKENYPYMQLINFNIRLHIVVPDAKYPLYVTGEVATDGPSTLCVREQHVGVRVFHSVNPDTPTQRKLLHMSIRDFRERCLLEGIDAYEKVRGR